MKGKRRFFYPNQTSPFLLKKLVGLHNAVLFSISRMLKSVSVIQISTGTFSIVNKVHNMICIIILVIFLIVLCISQFQEPPPPLCPTTAKVLHNSQPGFAPSELPLIYNLFLLSRDKICFKAKGE